MAAISGNRGHALLAGAAKERPRTRRTLGSKQSTFSTAGSPLAFACLVAVALYLGWRIREAQLLTAESGVGYALGIVGATIMLFLFLYPLRKKLAVMRRWGRVKLWFRAHMILGIVGPVLILFHANFKLGSLNSNVALFAMLLVVASGLIRRYIYSKVHNGLYGERATLAELKEALTAQKVAASAASTKLPVMLERSVAFDATMEMPRAGLFHCARALLLFAVTSRFARWRLERLARRMLADAAAKEGWRAKDRRRREAEVRDLIGDYFKSLGRIAEFAFFERLLALWHILHLPIFFFLFFSATIHILAVHLY